jgi:hypothetical protein
VWCGRVHMDDMDRSTMKQHTTGHGRAGPLPNRSRLHAESGSTLHRRRLSVLGSLKMVWDRRISHGKRVLAVGVVPSGRLNIGLHCGPCLPAVGCRFPFSIRSIFDADVAVPRADAVGFLRPVGQLAGAASLCLAILFYSWIPV